MKFKTYLIESSENKSYRKDIDKETAIDLIKTKCKNAELDKPIIRAVSKQPSSYQLLQGENSYRKPKSGKGFYNLFIDHFIKQENSKFPLRSSCVIGITFDGSMFASAFGDHKMAIIPFDDTYIAVSPHHDIWAVDVLDTVTDYQDFSILLDNSGIKSTNFDDIVKELSDILESDDVDDDLKEIFTSSDEKDIADTLDKIFNYTKHKSLGFTLVKNNSELLMNGSKEVWIGGKCIAIELKEYMKLKDEIKGNNKPSKEKEKYYWYTSNKDFTAINGVTLVIQDFFDGLERTCIKVSGETSNYKLLFNAFAKGQSKEVISELKNMLDQVKDKPSNTIVVLINNEFELIKKALKLIGKDGISTMYKNERVLFRV